jgi:hypothetical protein
MVVFVIFRFYPINDRQGHVLGEIWEVPRGFIKPWEPRLENAVYNSLFPLHYIRDSTPRPRRGLTSVK